MKSKHSAKGRLWSDFFFLKAKKIVNKEKKKKIVSKSAVFVKTAFL